MSNLYLYNDDCFDAIKVIPDKKCFLNIQANYYTEKVLNSTLE